ncbi:MAG: 5'/3'-nucleotidase SurE [Elusimicrobiota bacterium]
MKKILITNDDGISAPALDMLRKSLCCYGEVTVVAPSAPRNASGNSITLHKPVRVIRLDDGKYSVTGTTADCVRIGVLTILNGSVDLVVSGINQGANLGDDVNYSGTVAGAREGALLGIPSFAASLVTGHSMNFRQAAHITAEVAEKILENGLPERKLLNLNIPDIKDGAVKGIMVTRLGIRIYDNRVTKRIDPKGEDYYWIVGETLNCKMEKGTDFEAISKNYASLTPLSLDYTDRKLVEDLKSWTSD